MKQKLAKLLLSPATRNICRKSVCLVGFDGFTDSIVRCVQRRTSAQSVRFYQHITDFAKKVDEAAGCSGNFELVSQCKKLGGNAPIMASALVQTGFAVTLIGALGKPGIEDLFYPLVKRCKQAISLAPSGHTTAVEFADGKLLFGEHESVLVINEKLLKQHISQEKCIELFESLDLFASVNWTMLLGMTGIWKYLLKSIFPKIGSKKRIAFFDLADPAKRSKKDLQVALTLLSKMQAYFQVTLGLNVSESAQVAKLFSIKTTDLLQRASQLQKKLHIEQVVIHAHDKAYAADAYSSSVADGPYCKNPLMTTGGGDNFNAGFCLGRLLGLNLNESLILGNYTSGYYVRKATSPTLRELSNFLIDFQPRVL